MPNLSNSSQEWYYHAPSKKTNEEAKEVPAASQILGLSNVPVDHQEALDEDRHCRRKWVRDTDSKYIKLAKGGGCKDLLSYKQPPQHTSDQPVDYPRVDWFDHVHPEEDGTDADLEEKAPDYSHSQKKTGAILPDWYIHDDPQSSAEQQNLACARESERYKSKQQIMSFDNFSTWEREAMDEPQGRRKVKLPAIHKQSITGGKQRGGQHGQQQLSAAPAGKTSVRLPKIDESETVNFKYLMAMGYQRDWFEELKMKNGARNVQRQKQQHDKEEKRATQMREAIAMRKPTQVVEDEKPLFKLSKFKRVQPKVQTFRI